MNNFVCFGEILWDVFPDREIVGGAPLNVAHRLNSLKNHVSMISAVGKDTNGENLVAYLKDYNINTEGIQVIDNYETGKVIVNLDDKGSATYKLKYPVAWDKISVDDVTTKIVKKSDALIFGSLAARDHISRNTLLQLIKIAKHKIFDVNLRPPHYNTNVVTQLMRKADFIKLNDDELYEICQSMNSGFNSLEQNVKFIAEQTSTRHICVTKGKHGAMLFYNDELFYNKGYSIAVKDTVGAGDSFLGALVSQLLNETAPQKAIDFACAVGALVAQNEGANPNISTSDISAFLHPDN